MSDGDATRSGPPTDVLAGAAITLAAVAIGIEALSFETTFPTDPLGPKVFPIVSGLLLLLGGGWILAKPAAGRGEPLPWAVWGAAGSFVVYALALEPLGFLLSTVAELVVLSMLLGGRPVRSAIAGAAFSGALYLIFVKVLGLPLPIGSVFVIGG
jgi:putative tricarboxylic transport membrane protein